METERMKTALTGLQWTLGVVIAIEAVLFVLPGARVDFARTHMPDIVRQVLGWGEIIGAVLLVIPRTAVRGGYVLIAVFGLAIAVHLLHGMWNVGSVVIYTAAVWVIVAGKTVSRTAG